MSDRKSVCDHCGRSYAGDPLVSLGYVCIWCCTRVTDVLAMSVLLYDASGTTTGHDPAALLGAVHVDGSPCSEVAARRRAYIDGIAYEALGGTGEGLNFVRSLEVVEPPAWQAAAGDGEVPIALDLLAHHGNREVREIAPGNCVYVDYGTRAQGFIPLARVWGNGTEFMCELAPEGPATKTLPLNTAYLLANGWLPPNGDRSWHQPCSGSKNASRLAAAGLWLGRGCRQLDWYAWRLEGF